MHYKIYELVKPEHLQSQEVDGYSLKTIKRNILQEMDYSTHLSDDYSTIDEAVEAINKNIDSVKYKDLAIIPVVSINWDGTVF